jgi:hypothetical protein
MYSKELNLKAQAVSDVRAKLLKGTEDLHENQILDSIMRNFAKIGFKYTMKHVNYTEFLNGRLEGDCHTLADAFVQIAKEIGFDAVKLDGRDKIDIVVPGKPCIDSTRPPNIDRGRHWNFQNHYWGIDGDGGVYDILFTARQVDEMEWAHKNKELTYDDGSTGLTCETYGKKCFYSGHVGSDEYDMVCLEEDELSTIRENYKKIKMTEDQKAPSQVKEKETKPKEPEKEVPLFDLIKGSIKMVVPAEKTDATARVLVNLVDLSKIRTHTAAVLVPLCKNFCDGANALELEFNEKKWLTWIESNKNFL